MSEDTQAVGELTEEALKLIERDVPPSREFDVRRLIAEVRRWRAANALVKTPRGLMRQRSFLFSSGTGPAGVLCRWCGWKVERRTRNQQAVFDLAEGHDCHGVETAAERDARKGARTPEATQ